MLLAIAGEPRRAHPRAAARRVDLGKKLPVEVNEAGAAHRGPARRGAPRHGRALASAAGQRPPLPDGVQLPRPVERAREVRQDPGELEHAGEARVGAAALCDGLQHGGELEKVLQVLVCGVPVCGVEDVGGEAQHAEWWVRGEESGLGSINYLVWGGVSYRWW